MPDPGPMYARGYLRTQMYRSSQNSAKLVLTRPHKSWTANWTTAPIRWLRRTVGAVRVSRIRLVQRYAFHISRSGRRLFITIGWRLLAISLGNYPGRIAFLG